MSHLTRGIQRLSWTGHTQSIRARGRGHSDGVRIVFRAALDAVSGGEESVESLDQRRVSIEQRGNTLDDARGIDATAS